MRAIRYLLHLVLEIHTKNMSTRITRICWMSSNWYPNTTYFEAKVKMCGYKGCPHIVEWL